MRAFLFVLTFKDKVNWILFFIIVELINLMGFPVSVFATLSNRACLQSIFPETTIISGSREIQVFAPTDPNKSLDMTELFGGKDQVYLGITKGHYYLNVGNVRITGGTLHI